MPALLGWFAVNARDLPWRRTRDPYAIWVSEIMLQQTQVKTVIPFWERWLRELPTIEAAANASSEKLHKLWEGLGYYTRVRNLQKAARQIVESGKRKSGNISCQFPEKFNDVLALPGIGRYTAGAICSIAFNQRVPIVDGNVIRVLTRIFGIAENPKEKETNARLWKIAEDLVTDAAQSNRSSRREEAHSRIKNKKSLLTSAATTVGNCSALNQSLMELGALVCTPRNPQCLICPVKRFCVAFQKNLTEELPNLGKRETATARHFIAFVIERAGKFLVRQRPDGVVNAHLWEFPNVETGARLCEPQRSRLQAKPLRVTDPRSGAVAEAAMQIFGFVPKEITPLCTVKHSITRYRITLEAFLVSLKEKPTKVKGVWKTPAQMEKLAFTSAHKKILAKITNAPK